MSTAPACAHRHPVRGQRFDAHSWCGSTRWDPYTPCAGTGITGHALGRSELVHRQRTRHCPPWSPADEYSASQQFDGFLRRPSPAQAAKVGHSLTTQPGLVVLRHHYPGRSSKVTGVIQAPAKPMTGSAYAGLEQGRRWCPTGSGLNPIRQRPPMGSMGTRPQ